MGAFYGNITLTSPNQTAVAEALRGRRAIVAPSVAGRVVVFDSVCDDQNTDAMHALASRLSAELRCTALTVLVHDDDVFNYSLFSDGKKIDSYNSTPGYFSSESRKDRGGDPNAICSAFGVNCKPEVSTILRRPHGKRGYAFETDRHADLVRLLRLPECAVGKALASFDRGDFPSGLSADQMLRAADPPPVEDRQLRWDREFYEKLGPEDPSRPCRRDGCDRGAIPLSVMCRRHHFEMVKRRDCPFNE
jgi:hypothetical protein